MADLEALKQKYAPVISTIEEFQPYGASVEDVSLDGEQLHLKANVPSKVVLKPSERRLVANAPLTARFSTRKRTLTWGPWRTTSRALRWIC